VFGSSKSTGITLKVESAVGSGFEAFVTVVPLAMVGKITRLVVVNSKLNNGEICKFFLEFFNTS